MDDVFVYLTNLPDHVREMVTPCQDGYTIYIDKNLDEESQIKAFQHAMTHIIRNDFDKTNVQSIENNAHYQA